MGEPPAATVGTRAVIYVIAGPKTLAGQAPGFLPGYGQIPAEQVARLREKGIIQ